MRLRAEPSASRLGTCRPATPLTLSPRLLPPPPAVRVSKVKGLTDAPSPGDRGP